MSVSISPSAVAPSVDLKALYGAIVKGLQLLLDDTNYNLSSSDRMRIDDLLTQLLVWGIDLDIEPDTLEWLQQERVNEAAVVESNLRLIQSSLDELTSSIWIRPHEPETFGNALRRLVSDGRNLCELSTSLKIISGLHKETGPVSEVKKYMKDSRPDSSVARSRRANPGKAKTSKHKKSMRRSSQAGQQTPPRTQPDVPQDGNNSDPKDLGELLRQSEKSGSHGEAFWPRPLLERIISKDKEFLDQSVRLEEDLNESLWRDYLKVYALLALVEKTDEILSFVSEGVCDHDLPLHYDKGQFFKDRSPVSCFDNWRPFERHYFSQQQRGFTTPFFELGRGDAPTHYTLDNRAIIPWVITPETSASGVPSDKFGGFAMVQCISIDSDSHGFNEPLLEMGLDATFFALKTLHMNADEDIFKKEVDFSRRFSGREHPHLITLLASITHDEKFHFLFPYAECDLHDFWEHIHPWPPATEIEEAQWFVKQLLGLAGALDVIHNPKNQEGEPRYGRHGDIKPENILCFRSTDDPRGVLVLSDYGLSSLDRETSRSNVPNRQVGMTPTYRPPEFDMEGETISRAYDIWNFGCVFLEFVTWFLGGGELFQEFVGRRMSLDSGVLYNDTFFVAKIVKGEEKRSFQVKPQVTEWIHKLHCHPNCTDFLHDILTLVKTKMLVVISADIRRASSEQLCQALREIHCKSVNEAVAESYCLAPSPSSATGEDTAATTKLGPEKIAAGVKPDLRQEAEETTHPVTRAEPSGTNGEPVLAIQRTGHLQGHVGRKAATRYAPRDFVRSSLSGTVSRRIPSAA